MKPRTDVFISSTAIDLPEYRNAVRSVITTLGLFPSGMETWPVVDEYSVTLCRKKVEEAQIFIGIYAHRYGYCPPGYGGRGITDLEYDWATVKQIRRLCFFIKESYPWPSELIEYDAKPKLDAFKARAQTNFSGFFTTPDNLAKQVATALAATPEYLELNRPIIICNFVPPPDHFVGREEELTALGKALSDIQSVAITVMKGMGGHRKKHTGTRICYSIR